MDVTGKSSQKFSHLLDRVNSKICSWKFSKLSQPGRLILINSVLIEMAAHVLSVYLCPVGGLKKISSSLMRFWWASTSSKRPIYWRDKATLCNHKHDGGLGLKDIFTLNAALLARQSWRFHDHPRLLARKIFVGKYGRDPISMGRSNSVPRKATWAARSLIRASSSISEGIKSRIGNGRSTSIANHIWVGDAKIHPKPSSSSWLPPDANVSDLMHPNRTWNTSIIWRSFPPSTAENILATSIPKEDREDRICWAHTKNGKFSFKSGYWFLMNQKQALISRPDNSKF